MERGEIQADVRQQGPDFTGWASESVCLSLLWSLPLGLVILRRVSGTSFEPSPARGRGMQESAIDGPQAPLT